MARSPRLFMRQGAADLPTRAHVEAYTGPNGEVISDGDTLRLQDGATPGGVSLVSLRSKIAASFLGAAPRFLTDLLFAQCHAAIWGVEADTGTDQGPALRKAIAWAQSRGADLILPEGVIRIGPDPSDAEAVLRITRFMSMRGCRGTKLVPLPSVGTRHIILIKPEALGGGIRGMKLRDFQIGEFLAVDRAGGDGIRVDTTNQHGFVAKLTVSNVADTGAGVGKWSFYHLNTSTVDAQGNQLTGNLTGGLFGSTIIGCEFFGGAKFVKTGDSNNVLFNILTGPNAGLDYEAISGAAMHLVHGNNVTASGGGIIGRNTAQMKITHNQCESVHGYTGSNGALYTLDNCIDCEVCDNNGNSYDQTDVFLLKNGSTGNTVADNSTIYSTQAGKVLARLVGAPGNTIGRQHSDTAFTRDGQGNPVFTPRNRHDISVDTASHPTLGAFQPLTLAAGWSPGSDPAFFQGLSVGLKPDGDVALRGTIAATTEAVPGPGSPVAQLPITYWPTKAIRIGADMLIPGSPSTWGRAVFIIDTAGTITVQSATNGVLIQFDGTTYSRL